MLRKLSTRNPSKTAGIASSMIPITVLKVGKHKKRY